MIGNGYARGSLEDLVIQDAGRAVIGVVNARLRADEKDAATVLMDYMRRTLARGVSDQRAWSLLFAAAVGMFTEQIEYDEDPAGYLQLLALEHARSLG